MLIDDAENARTEILLLNCREDTRIEENGEVERVWKREGDGGRAEQWRGRRGRNISVLAGSS